MKMDPMDQQMPDETGGRPRVVVIGEFTSGKSSLINLLLRRPFLQKAVGLIVKPPVLIHSGFEDTDAELNEQTGHVELSAVMPDFPGVEIYELAIPVSGGLPDGMRRIVDGAALIVWCTIGSQAWRLTEKSVIESLPPDYADRSVLAVTRSDLFRSDEDRQKVAGRLDKEARQRFSDILFFDASRATIDRAAEDQVWQASGAAALCTRIAFLEGAQTPLSPVSPVSIFAAVDTMTGEVENMMTDLPAPVLEPAPDPALAPADPSPALPEASHDEQPIEAFMKLNGVLWGHVFCLDHPDWLDVIDGPEQKYSNIARAVLTAGFPVFSPDMADDAEAGEVAISCRDTLHLIQRLDGQRNYFVHLVLDREAGNLAQARRALQAAIHEILDEAAEG